MMTLADYQRGAGRAQGVGGPAISREQEAIMGFVRGTPWSRPPVETMNNGTVLYRQNTNPRGNVDTLMARLYPTDQRYSPNAENLSRLRNRTFRAMGMNSRSLASLQSAAPERAFQDVSGLIQRYGPTAATQQAAVQQQFRDNFRWLMPQGA